MYYEEKFENGVWYSRSTPDGAWSKKMRQMSKEDEPKWSEPVESNPDNVGGDVQKALDIADARLEDVKDIDFGEVFWACGVLSMRVRALAQQEPVNEELLSVLKEVLYYDDKHDALPTHIEFKIRKAVARAEQKGGV